MDFRKESELSFFKAFRGRRVENCEMRWRKRTNFLSAHLIKELPDTKQCGHGDWPVNNFAHISDKKGFHDVRNSSLSAPPPRLIHGLKKDMTFDKV